MAPIARTKERMRAPERKVMSVWFSPRMYVDLVAAAEREKRSLNSIVRESVGERLRKRKL